LTRSATRGRGIPRLLRNRLEIRLGGKAASAEKCSIA